RQDAAWSIKKCDEQVELSTGQRNIFATWIDHRARGRIGDEPLEVVEACCARLRARIMTSTKYCTDAGNEFAWIEWLTEIIVSSDLKTDDPIDIFLQCRKKDDRNVGSRC